jgi:choline dehydrogenase-like flavoprotein
MPDDQYHAIFVGTGFASSFFLAAYLKHAKPSDRILVLERGMRDTHKWQVEHRVASSMSHRKTFSMEGDPEKDWVYTIGFGGGSNCWWAGTPRMLPNDFRIQSKYNVGHDWPISYDDLEPHYQAAEEIMQVAGPNDGSPYPRSKPYPQPPHRFSDPDQILKKAYPDQFFVQPTARSRVPVKGRGICCANGVCTVCPANAKFTIENGLGHIYKDPRVTLRLGAAVESLDKRAGAVTGVRYREQGQERKASADIVVLGANALFNPHIMMRSGIEHSLLGRRLHEQLSLFVDVDLDGVDNFTGSTVITGLGYNFYDGDHRKERAACLIESWNKPEQMRYEKGKWRQVARLRLVIEDLPNDENRVKPNTAIPDRPIAYFKEFSAYAKRSIDALESQITNFLKPLPVERIDYNRTIAATENHIIGTTVMGNSEAESVIDRHLIHHDLRNLVVLGSGAFPTCSPANPSLTIAALSLWSAAYITGMHS